MTKILANGFEFRLDESDIVNPEDMIPAGESLDTVRDTLYARLHGRRFDSLAEKKQSVKHILSEVH